MVGDDRCNFCRIGWLGEDGIWEVLSVDANLSMRNDGLFAATPEYLFFKGGTDPLSDFAHSNRTTAALFSVADRSWLTEEPPTEFAERTFLSVHWTGEEFLSWGGSPLTHQAVIEPDSEFVTLYDGLMFNPVSRQWRAMPAARPEGHHVWGKNPPDGHMTSVWTSAGLFVWGMTPEEDASWGAIFDQQTETWRDVSSKGAPPPRRYQASLTLGGDVYVFSGRPPAGGEYSRRLWRYSLSQDTWHELDVPDYASPYKGSVVGGKLAFLGDCAAGTLYDPNRNAWELLSPVGAPTSRDGVMRTVGDVITITGVYEGEQEISDVHVLDLAP